MRIGNNSQHIGNIHFVNLSHSDYNKLPYYTISSNWWLIIIVFVGLYILQFCFNSFYNYPKLIEQITDSSSTSLVNLSETESDISDFSDLEIITNDTFKAYEKQTETNNIQSMYKTKQPIHIIDDPPPDYEKLTN